MCSLIIGGTGQGKLEFAKIKFNLKDEDIINIEDEDYNNQICIYNLHNYIKKCIEQNIDFDIFIDSILKNKDIIIICNEVGCGIVPIDKTERIYRDAVGRVCCRIAKYCDNVIRVYCGIAEVIK